MIMLFNLSTCFFITVFKEREFYERRKLQRIERLLHNKGTGKLE